MSLFQRLKRAGELLLRLGFRKIVFLGSDSPLIDKPYLKSAFDALERFPLVIGPSRDGDYVLLLKPLFDIDTLRDFRDYLKFKKGILTNLTFRLNLRKKLI